MKAYSSEKALPFVSCNIINTRETDELTIQRNWQHWVENNEIQRNWQHRVENNDNPKKLAT